MFYGHHIEPLEVHAEALTSILLVDEHHGPMVQARQGSMTPFSNIDLTSTTTTFYAAVTGAASPLLLRLYLMMD